MSNHDLHQFVGIARAIQADVNRIGLGTPHLSEEQMLGLTHFDVVWMQTLGGGTGVLHDHVPREEALTMLHDAQVKAARGDFGSGIAVFLRPSNDVLAAVAAEVQRAGELHAPLNSAHEAYSVLLEEVEEFWDEVKKKQRDRDSSKMRAELVQIAAMAVRTIENLNL